LINVILIYRAESLAAQLSSHGHAALSISGSQTQTKRLQTLLKLRQFQCRILVATDLAARGIDAENIDLVVHMDVPRDPSTYLHRVGRAGRFGAAALACSIACEGDELTELRSIITRTKASVRILSGELLAPPDQTILSLETLWSTLPELEGTGLEGSDVADSLLTDLETNKDRPKKTSTSLFPQSNKKRNNTNKNQSKKNYVAREEPEVLEVGLAKLNLECNHEENNNYQERCWEEHQKAWRDWIQSWTTYAKQSKAFVQQSEYLRLMSQNL